MHSIHISNLHSPFSILHSCFQEEKEGDWYVEPTSQEVGIDVPNEAPHQQEEAEEITPIQRRQPMMSSSQPSLNNHQQSPHSSTTLLASQTSLEQEQPSRGSMRARAVTMGTNSLPSRSRGRSPGDFQRSASPLLNAMSLQRSDSKLSSVRTCSTCICTCTCIC